MYHKSTANIVIFIDTEEWAFQILERLPAPAFQTSPTIPRKREVRWSPVRTTIIYHDKLHGCSFWSMILYHVFKSCSPISKWRKVSKSERTTSPPPENLRLLKQRILWHHLSCQVAVRGYAGRFFHVHKVWCKMLQALQAVSQPAPSKK